MVDIKDFPQQENFSRLLSGVFMSCVRPQCHFGFGVTALARNRLKLGRSLYD